jgi:COMPASS component BRE2
MFRANYVHQIPKIPGQAKKRKADALEDGQVASPAGAVPGGPTELAANPPATNDAAPALERNQSDTSTNTMPLFSSAIPVKAGHVMPKEEPFIIPPERVSARASKPVVTSDPPTATPQKPTVDRALATPVADGPRERKPTAKKAAATAPRKDIVQAQQESVPSGNSVLRAAAGAFRFRPPPYKPGDLTASLRLPARIPVESANEETFYAMADLPFNKRGFRYSTCEAAPSMPSIMYRSVELPPHAARIDWSDMSQYVYLSRDALSATTDKGFRTARANVGAREGSWYWEVKVLCGNGDRGGHVRLGVARREATLDAPVGFDGYGYGLRDRGGEKMHLSRPRAFMDESFGTGDVIGFHLQLPPLPTNAAATASLVAMAQAKPKQSKSKKAGTSQGAQNTAQTVVRGAGGVAGLVSRERIPIRYRGQLYFEQLEYVGTREMEDRLNPATAAAAALSTSSSNKQLTSKPTFVPGTLEDPDAVLKGSSLVIYKNGKRMGTAFTDLLNFLPPFSQTSATQALATSSGNPIAAGTALAAADDGTLGYYPAISVFSGGAARFNFGPEFDFPPAVKDVKPMSERYAEQIAEDIVMDLLDEVDFGLMDEAMGYKPEPPAIPASDIGVLPGAIGTPDRDIMVAHEPIVDVKMEHAAQT